MNANNMIFPLDSDFLIKRLSEWEIDLEHVSIRELNRLVDELSKQFEIEFLRFESQLILAPKPTGLNKSCNGMNLRRVKPKMISSSLVELLDR